MYPYKAPLFAADNHLMAAPSPGPWLVDTGSSVSLSTECPVLPILGVMHSVSSEYRGVTMEKVAELSGIHAIGLLGNDALSRHHVRFNFSTKAKTSFMAFSNEPIAPIDDTKCVAFDLREGIPVLEALLADTESRTMVFDTGAQISYLADPTWLTGTPSTKRTDYLIGHGRFEVDVHRVRIRLGSVQAELDFAHHPAVNTKLQALKADGIIGWEILKHGPALYSLANRELWI
jgi:hypothetical protein